MAEAAKPAVAGAPLAAPEPPRPPTREQRWGVLIDPGKTCKLEFEADDSVAILEVPGEAHVLSTELGRMNAPRLLRPVSGDFDVRVRVLGTERPGGKPTMRQYPPFHGAGILVWQDPDNYVRLEISSDVYQGAARHYTNFEYRSGGRMASSQGKSFSDGSNYLWLQRRGSQIRASFSADGEHWVSFPLLSAPLAGDLQVGLDAINSASKPLAVRFADYTVTPRPGPIDKGLNPPG
jgi:regulation of enolase protein 1 (concanavalin A-like superfamily)